jgi:hypothetical protein
MRKHNPVSVSKIIKNNELIIDRTFITGNNIEEE